MAGKNHFKKGLHPSRQGMYFEFRSDIGAPHYDPLCQALGARLSPKDFYWLMLAIHEAMHEEILSAGRHATRKDALAQLKAMSKIKSDTKLIEALKNTDINTFMMINQAQTDLISEKIDKNGYFIDSRGSQYIIPIASLDQYPLPGVEYYLPDGIAGLQNAVSLALQRCRIEKDKAGRKEIKSRRPLADLVWSLWKEYRPDASQEIWHRDGKCSPALSFAHEVFAQIIEKVELSSLAELMKERYGYKKRSK